MNPRFLLVLLKREITNRYLSSFSGYFWTFIQPLFILGIYAFVFTEIFKPRFLENGISFIAFFSVALWPWTAFSESISRSLNAIPEQASLLSKVNIPHWAIILSPVLASFLINVVGFFIVIMVLRLTGYPISFSGALISVLPLLGLLVFAIGCATILATLSVFIRDICHIAPQVLSLLFFLTPVMYSSNVIPAKFATWMRWNPIGTWLELIRSCLFGLHAPSTIDIAYSIICLVISLLLAGFLYRRLSPYFEDFI